jgi:hypothetical protein
VVVLHDKYGVVPRFVHTDKDMAEIGASQRTWTESKHQLCWWHLREALKRRVKGNLPMSVYHPQKATYEYTFITPSFKPHGRTDLGDTEGSAPGEVCEQEDQHSDASAMPLSRSNPNSIKIRIPALASQCLEEQEPKTRADHSKPLVLRIPPLSLTHNTTSNMEDEPDEDVINSQRTFYPVEHRKDVFNMMEHHLCAHPLIPGYSARNLEGIKAWAVKQMYDFCVLHDLPNLWAYLWENWYRHGRWELWARCSASDEIPRLKTMMMAEAQ